MQPLPADPTERANLLKLLLKLYRMSPEDRKVHLERMRAVKADSALEPSRLSSQPETIGQPNPQAPGYVGTFSPPQAYQSTRCGLSPTASTPLIPLKSSAD